ncbi:MAG: hypothetical protein DRG82_16905 [Deltaproteobacteria bacterium]|nr:MAG: hypothetical protein DRG82_16905 [Deltaproteobacteria bacterium]
MPEKKQEASHAEINAPSHWEILARERNARVIMCHTPDTYILTGLAKSADRAMRALRDRVYTTVTSEEAEPLFHEYNEVVLRLHQIVEKISGKLDIRYRPPRAIVTMLGSDEKEDGDGDGADHEGPGGKTSKTKLS